MEACPCLHYIHIDSILTADNGKKMKCSCCHTNVLYIFSVTKEGPQQCQLARIVHQIEQSLPNTLRSGFYLVHFPMQLTNFAIQLSYSFTSGDVCLSRFRLQLPNLSFQLARFATNLKV